MNYTHADIGALFYIWLAEKKIANNFLQAMSGGNFLNEKRNLDIIFAYTINLPWIIQQTKRILSLPAQNNNLIR